MLIGLSGYAQSGKDTLASFLVGDYGFERRAFADKLREALYNLNPMVNYSSDQGKLEWFRLQDALRYYDGWDNLKKHSTETRTLMQRMGTEVGRQLFGEDVWVDLALADIEGKDIVVTDVRFPNEVDAIRERGGQVWRINRPGVAPVNPHVSEIAIDGYSFDNYIINDGGIEDLRRELWNNTSLTPVAVTA